jgi:hypothetical protein
VISLWQSERRQAFWSASNVMEAKILFDVLNLEYQEAESIYQKTFELQLRTQLSEYNAHQSLYTQTKNIL